MNIGRFQILDELGRGGMGVVYRALDPDLDRPVAIKKLTSVTHEHLERFRQEARAAGRLMHANITTVYESGVDSGEPYIVMEFLDGASLRQHIRERTLPPVRERLEITRQVCLGLDYAHNQGVAAHRDIKPANIQVTSSGITKIMDFGIAKLADEINLTKNLTQANMVLGTLHYLSPEQIRGDRIDGRSDIWSLGVMLYELLYGVKPFDDEEDDTVMKKIVLEELATPPLLDLAEEDDLRTIVLRALEKERDRRYPTAAEMAADIQGWLRATGETTGKYVPGRGAKNARTWFDQGSELYAAGQFVRAIECFRRVLELKPTHEVARQNIAVCEQAQAKKHAEDLYRVGMLLFKNREYGVAAAAFEELLRADPTNDDARTMIAWARREGVRREEKGATLADLVETTLYGIVAPESEPTEPTIEHVREEPPREAPRPRETRSDSHSRHGSGARQSAPAAREPVPVAAERDRSTSRVSAWIKRLFAR